MQFGLLKSSVFTGRIKDFVGAPPDISHKDMEWRVFRRNLDPSFDPAIQKLGPETFDVKPTEVVASRTVVALTQQELDGIDQGKILAGVLDLGFIVIKLVDALIAKNTIAASDFDAETRQAYLGLKATVDRLRP